jgi:hypothetical protein
LTQVVAPRVAIPEVTDSLLKKNDRARHPDAFAGWLPYEEMRDGPPPTRDLLPYLAGELKAVAAWLKSTQGQALVRDLNENPIHDGDPAKAIFRQWHARHQHGRSDELEKAAGGVEKGP